MKLGTEYFKILKSLETYGSFSFCECNPFPVTTNIFFTPELYEFIITFFIFSKIKDAVSIHNLLASCISDAKKPRKILDVCGGCGNIAFTLGLLNESETIDCVEIVDRWKNFWRHQIRSCD